MQHGALLLCLCASHMVGNTCSVARLALTQGQRAWRAARNSEQAVKWSRSLCTTALCQHVEVMRSPQANTFAPQPISPAATAERHLGSHIQVPT